MRKNYLLLAAAAVAMMTACSDDMKYGNQLRETSETAIAFGSQAPGNYSRGEITGATAATALGDQFVVEGGKTIGGAYSVVFDDYVVAYNGNANSTTTNSNGWEYVGGTSKNSAAQTIKYWDNKATQYDFVAYSANANVTASTIDLSNKGTNNTVFTLTGPFADVVAAYIADEVTVQRTDYEQVVTLKFRSTSVKVRMGLYETIPGYKVKDVKFYASDTDDSPTPAPTLYAADEVVTDGSGETTLTVTYPTITAGLDRPAIAVSGATAKSSTLAFDALTYTGGYLGTTAIAASYDAQGYKNVLPMPGTELTLKIDFTLESEDGSGEEINITAAEAVVPAEYATWKANFAYTYLFKISQSTGGLTPITFDAVVIEEEDNQQTITVVETPSITTAFTTTDGDVVSGQDECTAGDIVYASVRDGGTVAATDLETRIAVYTATTTGEEINEATVANALVNPGGNITVTPYTGTVTFGDYTVGSTTVAAAKFTTDGTVAAGTYYYVIEYTNGTTKAYKVVKVKKA